MKLQLPLVYLVLIAALVSLKVYPQQHQKISHGGINLNIPQDWFYQTLSNPNGNRTVETAKKGEKNSFTINKINFNLTSEQGLDMAHDMVANFDLFNSAKFTPYKKKMYNGYSSAETSFTVNFQGMTFKGKFIAFKSGQAIYLIMYMGEEAFINGKVLQSILNSVIVD